MILNLEPNYNYSAIYETEEESHSFKNSPEKALLFAILQRSLIDLKDKDPKIRADALYWFNSSDSRDENVWGTFSHICDNLDIKNASRLKALILKNSKAKKVGKGRNGSVYSIRRRRS
jgi:hypothetical protein